MADLTLEERVARLEGALGWEGLGRPLTLPLFFLALAFGLVGLVLLHFSLGVPNHYYQYVLAGATVLLAYHQGWLALPRRWFEWILPAINIGLLSIASKIVIGAGERFPLYWAKFPFLAWVGKKDKGWLKNPIPTPSLTWEPTDLAFWTVDLTVVQTFLVLLVLLGALFRFSLFASLCAFFLIIVSLPALLEFDWNWVFPAILCTGVAFYLQSGRGKHFSSNTVPAK